jgi:class 3 adenylate cyclase
MDISAWLKELGLERYDRAFQENEIDAEILPNLTADDLNDMGVVAVGHRRKLLKAIAALAEAKCGRNTERDAEAKTVPITTATEAERRQVTVLFCDLVGSTELSTKLDPEDMGELLRTYQTNCADVVNRWGGHVANYMGDGVLAYFGWPQAHEDGAERAVRCGLDLTERIAGLVGDGGVPLAARIGIATGLVMVGEVIGSNASQGDTVVGETPNLAARLQALAEARSVVIDTSCRELVGSLFNYADLGPCNLKGFAAPIQAWRVIGDGRVESRFEALHGQKLPALVGREHELGLLRDRWEKTEKGEVNRAGFAGGCVV